MTAYHCLTQQHLQQLASMSLHVLPNHPSLTARPPDGGRPPYLPSIDANHCSHSCEGSQTLQDQHMPALKSQIPGSASSRLPRWTAFSATSSSSRPSPSSYMNSPHMMEGSCTDSRCLSTCRRTNWSKAGCQAADMSYGGCQGPAFEMHMMEGWCTNGRCLRTCVTAS